MVFFSFSFLFFLLVFSERKKYSKEKKEGKEGRKGWEHIFLFFSLFFFFLLSRILSTFYFFSFLPFFFFPFLPFSFFLSYFSFAYRHFVIRYDIGEISHIFLGFKEGHTCTHTVQ